MTDLHAIPRPPARQQMPETAEKVFTGFNFSVYHWQQTLFDGSKAVFEKIARKDSVGVVAVTTDGKVVLGRQEQPSILPFIGLLGGVIDDGETPFAAAQRELLEEAGMHSSNWSLWFSSQPMTKIDWAVYIFVARDCSVTATQKLEGGEKISIEPISYEDFITAAFQPEFRDFEVSLKIAQLTHTGRANELRRIILG